MVVLFNAQALWNNPEPSPPKGLPQGARESSSPSPHMEKKGLGDEGKSLSQNTFDIKLTPIKVLRPARLSSKVR